MLSRIRRDNGLRVTKYIRVFGKGNCNNIVCFYYYRFSGSDVYWRTCEHKNLYILFGISPGMSKILSQARCPR